jgi:hypothetical protein
MIKSIDTPLYIMWIKFFIACQENEKNPNATKNTTTTTDGTSATLTMLSLSNIL